MKKNLINCLLSSLVLLSACKKDDTYITPAPVLNPTSGVYVLSEGSFGGNNTKFAYRPVSSGVVTGDFFLAQNPTHTGGLGDTGSDMIIYGGKLYIVMNVTSNVTVLNTSTGTFIKQIDFVNGTAPRSPRFAVATRGKVYVTAYDNTVSVIDTSSLAIIKTINVGANPEGIAIAGNHLYVANSGGFNPVADSTVSVVDLDAEVEVTKIKVGLNPQKVQANSAGDVYVSSYGNFSTILPSISVINSTTNTIKTTLGSEYSYNQVRIFNDVAYLYNNYGGPGSKCKLLNTLTNTTIRDEFITDGTVIDNVYGINMDIENGDIYIMDSHDFVAAGTVTCFDKFGVKKFSFSVAPGVNPNTVVFLR